MLILFLFTVRICEVVPDDLEVSARSRPIGIFRNTKREQFVDCWLGIKCIKRTTKVEPTICPLPIDSLEERGYRVFSDELENDGNVLFHATAVENLKPIQEKGLLPGVQVGGRLETISYASNSMIALTHWVSVRTKDQDGVILALRFKTLDEIFVEEGTHRSRALKTQPTLVAVCPVPRTYQHR